MMLPHVTTVAHVSFIVPTTTAATAGPQGQIIIVPDSARRQKMPRCMLLLQLLPPPPHHSPPPPSYSHAALPGGTTWSGLLSESKNHCALLTSPSVLMAYYK